MERRSGHSLLHSTVSFCTPPFQLVFPHQFYYLRLAASAVRHKFLASQYWEPIKFWVIPCIQYMRLFSTGELLNCLELVDDDIMWLYRLTWDTLYPWGVSTVSIAFLKVLLSLCVLAVQCVCVCICVADMTGSYGVNRKYLDGHWLKRWSCFNIDLI